MKFWDWLMQDGEGARPKENPRAPTGPNPEDETLRAPASSSVVDEIMAAGYAAAEPVAKEGPPKNERHPVRPSLPRIAYSDFILTVIAIALCAIAFKLFSVPRLTTMGDIRALRNIEGADERKAARVELLNNIPLIHIEGGRVDADVSGSVSVE